MDRSQVLDVVIKHMRRNISDLGDQPVDPAKSMMDYGASSLDVVEVVSSSMRELNLRIPAADLVDLQNIDGLVDRLAAAPRRDA